MRSCFSSSVFLLSALLLFRVAFAQDRTTSFQPLTQTSGDFTVTLKKAAWCHSSEVASLEAYRLHQDIAGLGLWYEVKSSRANVRIPPGQKLENFVQSIQLSPRPSPDVEQVFELFPRSGTAWNDEVNPREKKLEVEFELLDPAAPADARGEWIQSLHFSRLPVPRDESIMPLQRVVSTLRGTRVVIEKVARRNGLLVLVMRLFPPMTVPDMKARFFGTPGSYDSESELPVLTDETGQNIKALGLDIFDVLDDKRPDWEWPLTLSMALPQSSAKTFDVDLKVKESAPSLKQWQWFHRFRFALNPASIPHLLRVTPWTGRDEAAVVETSALQATLEAVKPDYGNWQLRFWWRNRKKPAFPDQTWRLTKLLGIEERKPDDGEWGVNDGSVSPYPIFWHLDGTVPARDERGEAEIIRQGTRPFQLRAEVESVRFQQNPVTFKALPLPAPGQSLPLNLEEVTPMGTRIILRDIHHVVTRDPIAGMSEHEFNSLWTNRHAGFIYFFVDVQSPKGREVDIKFGEIRDELGHRRDAQWQGMEYQGRRVFSIPVPAGAKKLDFQLSVKEVQPLGLRESITFPQVAPPSP